ncbi:MAG: response regulator [Actinomycetota bacterium]
MQPRRVLLVEDDPFTAGLTAAALTAAAFDVRTAASAREAREALADFDPDAAVIDLYLGPGPTGVDIAHIIDQRHPGVALLLLTQLPDLRAAGFTLADIPASCSFLRKEAISDAESLVAAVEQALADHVVRTSREESPLAALTETQLAVLRAVAQGYTSPRIAEMRGTTTSAVEKALGSIYDALRISGDGGVSRRSEAMRVFIEYAGIPARD